MKQNGLPSVPQLVITSRKEVKRDCACQQGNSGRNIRGTLGEFSIIYRNPTSLLLLRGIIPMAAGTTKNISVQRECHSTAKKLQPKDDLLCKIRLKNQ